MLCVCTKHPVSILKTNRKKDTQHLHVGWAWARSHDGNCSVITSHVGWAWDRSHDGNCSVITSHVQYHSAAILKASASDSRALACYSRVGFARHASTNCVNCNCECEWNCECDGNMCECKHIRVQTYTSANIYECKHIRVQVKRVYRGGACVTLIIESCANPTWYVWFVSVRSPALLEEATWRQCNQDSSTKRPQRVSKDYI